MQMPTSTASNTSLLHTGEHGTQPTELATTPDSSTFSPSAPTVQPAADPSMRTRPTTAPQRTAAGCSITSDGMAC